MDTSTQQFVLFIAAALFIVNVGSVTAIWWDKRRAKKDQWRIKESTILVWALVGGWPGGIWAMRRFRHKTSKQSFIVKYVLVVLLSLTVAAAAVFTAIG
ncbi:MAG: DUF1294 domain-containing protein [Dehalococcoidia bacterium]|nr:DUF1294 domain-containing protein [Dehalococcoidia bacterium]